VRFPFLSLLFAAAILSAGLADAQDQGQGGRRRRGGYQGDNGQNGGERFPGGGGYGGYPGGGYSGYPGGGPGGWGGGGPGNWGGGGPGNMGGGGPGGWGGGGPGFQGAGGFLQRFDANHDGQIDASEAQAAGPRARFLEGMIRQAGLEPKYPIKVSAIQEGMQNGRNNGYPGGGPNGPPGGNFGFPPGPSGGPSSPPGSGGPAANADAKPVATPAPLVPGFGVEQKNVAVPGFDVAAKPGATVAASAASSAAAPDSADALAVPPERLEATIRTHAEAMIKQNDKDHSGALERDKGEWEGVRDAKAIDKDRNNIITLEEMTAFQLAQNGGKPAKKADPAAKPAAAPVQPDPLVKSVKTYRVLSPIERLPEGLPDWFARDDANGDGQVSMSEFTHDWTPTKAAEFTRYDLNGDGIITTDECLKVEKKK
jgi:hypothetical protein